MKRPVFPFLFAVFPVLSLFSANVNIVPAGDLFRPLLIALALTILVWAAARLVFKTWTSAGAFASVLSFGFFEFGPAMDLAAPRIGDVPALLVYSVLVLGVSVGLALLLKSSEWPNLLGAALVLAAIGSSAFSYVVAGLSIGAVHSKSTSSSSVVSSAKPDVFYIILDGYGRSDAVKKYIGYDNSGFIQSLRDQGFYVADQSRSNYCQTQLSLSSSLNMDYLQDLLPPGHEEEQERLVFQDLIGDSRVEKEFARLGYLTVAVTSGFPEVQFPKADLQAIDTKGSLSLFEAALWQNTPLRVHQEVSVSMYDLRRANLYAALETLKKLGETGHRPRLILAHVLAPHPPFVVSADGKPVRPPGPFAYFDGSDYMTHNGNSETYAKGYAAQATYTSGQVLEIVRAILSQEKAPPIIIIQGDHGSKRFLSQDDVEKSELTEVFPNLNAYFVPPELKSRLYPTITPVNSFRLVLSYLGVNGLEPLPDKSYWSPFSYPQKFLDVTNRSQLASGTGR